MGIEVMKIIIVGVKHEQEELNWMTCKVDKKYIDIMDI